MSDSKELQINIALTAVNNMLDRSSNVPDQATRTLLFLDKLFMIIDVGMGALAILDNDSGLSEKIKEQVRITSDKLKKEISLSTEWILSPQYSPDHPFGNSEMKKAQQSFNSTA